MIITNNIIDNNSMKDSDSNTGNNKIIEYE